MNTGIDLDGLEPLKINEGTKNLVIVVQGYGGNPPNGATQYEYDSVGNIVKEMQIIDKNIKRTYKDSFNEYYNQVNIIVIPTTRIVRQTRKSILQILAKTLTII